jgi:signal transduction histidine kinase
MQMLARLVFAAAPRRVVGELALLMLALGLLLPLLGPLELGRQGVLLLLAPLGGLLAALRLRMPQGSRWYQLIIELRDALLMGGVLSFGCLFVLRILLGDAQFQLWPPVEGITTVLVLNVGLIAYSIFRATARGWLFWDQLRRQRLLWALTHAQLTLVAVAVFGFALMQIGSAAVRDPGLWGDLSAANPLSPFAVRLLMNVLPVLAVVILGSLGALLLVLPPAALVSFLVARRTTRRVEDLAAAADALRSGAYATRVPATGADELARLQTAFNAMAAQLEQTLGDLQAERDRVAELLAARRQMIAAVSHELRTPVATLRGYLETRLERWDATHPADLHADLVVMDHETQRLQHLIDDLFTLARADAGGLALELITVDLHNLIQNVVATVAPLGWRTARVTVIAEIADAPLTVCADPARLEQCLINLVRNALRHTPPGGIVAVSAQPTAAGVAMIVRDTGEGIPPTELPHIWTPFYRGEQGRHQDASGAGLGLALVRELIMAMGGTVAVASTPGAGSSFTLYLPAAEAFVSPREH